MKTWEFLSKPGVWTQGAFARNKFGVKLISAHDPTAVRWCMYGAWMKCNNQCAVPREIRNLVEETLGQNAVPWNDDDNRTQEEVVAVWKSLDL